MGKEEILEEFKSNIDIDQKRNDTKVYIKFFKLQVRLTLTAESLHKSVYKHKKRLLVT